MRCDESAINKQFMAWLDFNVIKTFGRRSIIPFGFEAEPALLKGDDGSSVLFRMVQDRDGSTRQRLRQNPGRNKFAFAFHGTSNGFKAAKNNPNFDNSHPPFSRFASAHH